MRKQYAFRILCLILVTGCNMTVHASAQIIHVPGDQSTIQAGINAANQGDTVLVDPGIYPENIDFSGKNITVASLYLTSLDTGYISATVIDGNKAGAVVLFVNSESPSAMLCGFTIRNGISTSIINKGAGIRCYNASPVMKNLIIRENTDVDGGGIGIIGGAPQLNSIIIRSNEGGGLYYRAGNGIIEDVIVLNNLGTGAYIGHTSSTLRNIFISGNSGVGMLCQNVESELKNVTIKNNAGGGLIVGGYDNPPCLVFDSVERCNIYNNAQNYSEYNHTYDIHSSLPFSMNVIVDTFTVLHPTDYYADPVNSFVFDIKHAIIQQIDGDVFISPNGDDSNSGMTPDEPLKTIKHAFEIQVNDKYIRNKIYLLEGRYGTGFNGEPMPVLVPSYYEIEGVNDSTVIIDGEGNSMVMRLGWNEFNRISNLTVTGGMTGERALACNSNSVELENMRITGNSGGGISIMSSDAKLSHMRITDNTAQLAAGIYCYASNVEVRNSLITGNFATVKSGGIGGLISSPITIINSTIVNNHANEGAGGIGLGNSWASFTNSIIRGNTPVEIESKETSYPWPSYDVIYISNSNVEGGMDSIHIQEGDTIHWLDGNIDADPLFLLTGSNPLELSVGSPCIDAGTTDTAGLNLPATDLAGNPRIWNGRVDMGAYEWNNVGYYEYRISDNDFRISNYPNPFSSSTTIEFELTITGSIEFLIVDQFGQVVDKFPYQGQMGINKLTWDAGALPAGVYFCRIAAGGGIQYIKMIHIR